jgi:hypothetical protein
MLLVDESGTVAMELLSESWHVDERVCRNYRLS